MRSPIKGMDLRPVPDEPAATFGRALVIGDVHLGLELALEKDGVLLPPQTESLREKVERLLSDTSSSELLILGDVKHSLAFEDAEEVQKFFCRFPVPFSIVPGNHDGLLNQILPQAKIHPPSGVRIGDTCFLHGHALPSPELLDSPKFVISHSHPVISFVDSAGARTKVPCWMKTEVLLSEQPAQLIVMPAFNPLLGGGALNERKPLGPIMSRADIKKAQIYLLDSSFLGELSSLSKD